MASLIVRNIDADVVQRLKEQAVRNGRSAEAEHRAILDAALVAAPRRALTEVLASMPNVGKDEDFHRTQDEAADDVFD